MTRLTRWLGAAAALALVVSTAQPGVASAQTPPPFDDQPKRLERLAGRAVLPAATFADGPTSGTRIGGPTINGVAVPFVDAQPVQGVSALLDNGDGTFLALSDNGFGSLENSADYHLRLYTVTPDFATKDGGSGDVAVGDFIELSDPDGHIHWATTNHFTEERILTGADLDIESVQRAPDGTLWIGDEFGPFLLHFSADGLLLEPPYPLPDFDNGGELRSPQTPLNQEATTVRLMNALRTHARLHGATHDPVVSPTNGMVPSIINPVSLNAAGYQVIPWTVNTTTRQEELIAQGVDGIITDRPDLLYGVVAAHDADGDGTPGDWLLPDGRIDPDAFDAQGHRGARGLRPENTLPSFEAALDNLMTTLEGDTGVSADGVSMVDHDSTISASKCRRLDGQPYTGANQVRVNELTAAEIQSTFVCDGLVSGAPQTNDRALSPASVAFAAAEGLADPYVMPTADQVLRFVAAYEAYYRTGPGSGHPDAQVRADNAATVRFNIETKVSPSSEAAGTTAPPLAFVQALGGAVAANAMEARVDIQSFDWRTLLLVHEHFPAIRTAFLFGGNFNATSLGGLFWPTGSNASTSPVRVPGSGGFEGMALSPDGTTLYPLLEKPLAGATPGELLFHEFDLGTRAYTGNRWVYPMDPQGAAIGDFVLHDDTHGLIIERDNSQGDVNGHKKVYEIRIGAPGTTVQKRLAVDLMRLGDPYGLGRIGTGPGDVGVDRVFAFPFVTIESVVVFDRHTIGIVNDNNFPFSVGRHVGSGAPDDTEMIVIQLRRELRH